MEDPLEIGHHERLREFHAAQMWLLAELKGSPDRFSPFLSLSNVKPFSLGKILPIPGIEAVLLRFSEPESG